MQLPLPENEAERVEALRSYRILDTPPEERFDDVARLAAYVCGTSIGLIGLLDSSREWFKSRVGWDVNEIPREVSFSTYAILQDDVFIVSDTLNDKRFARNHLATRAGVRRLYRIAASCTEVLTASVESLRKLRHRSLYGRRQRVHAFDVSGSLPKAFVVLRVCCERIRIAF